MRNRRTTIDFSRHVLTVKKDSLAEIFEFKRPDTINYSIKFICTCGILAVTGDFGNWIFCRPFDPSEDGYVSDGYWLEKLQISSDQKGTKYSSEDTEHSLKEKIAELEFELEEEFDLEIHLRIEYYKECLGYVDDELEYTHYAYREMAPGMDYDEVIFIKDTVPQLKCVFDGFDEMCRIYKENPNAIVHEAIVAV